jgi:hypothetical protein
MCKEGEDDPEQDEQRQPAQQAEQLCRTQAMQQG